MSPADRLPDGHERVVEGVPVVFVRYGSPLREEIDALAVDLFGDEDPSGCSLCPAKDLVSCGLQQCEGGYFVPEQYIPVLKLRSKT